MNDLLQKVEQFLTYSDEKLEELSSKNKSLTFKEDNPEKNERGKHA
ncbi:MAG: SP_0009 family protein [Streptococcus sp.]|nr:SP_0009 family protein [Streptococcus sp.]